MTKREPRICGCGCGELTAGAEYRPGHVERIRHGYKSPAEAEEAQARKRREAKKRRRREATEGRRRERERRAALTPEDRAAEDARADAFYASIERRESRESMHELYWTWGMHLEEALEHAAAARYNLNRLIESGEVVLVPDHLTEWFKQMAWHTTETDRLLNEQHGRVVPFRRVANKRHRLGGHG